MDNRQKAILKEKIDIHLKSDKLELPVLPKAASKIIEVINNPDADLKEVTNIVQYDQAISGYILRVANSANYGSNMNIVSLSQAVARLGTKLISEVTISFLLNSSLFKSDHFRSEIKQIYRHSICTALYAKEIARFKRMNVEAMFICGLLHSTAKPAILSMIGSVAKHLDFEDDVIDGIDELDGLIEELIPRVNELMIAKWDLPEIVRYTCINFRNYKTLPKFANEGAIINLSTVFGNWLMKSNPDTKKLVAANPSAQYLNIYQDELKTLFEKEETIRIALSSIDL